MPAPEEQGSVFGASRPGPFSEGAFAVQKSSASLWQSQWKRENRDRNQTQKLPEGDDAGGDNDYDEVIYDAAHSRQQARDSVIFAIEVRQNMFGGDAQDSDVIKTEEDFRHFDERVANDIKDEEDGRMLVQNLLDTFLPYNIAMQCVCNLLEQKIASGNKDQVSVVFFGTKVAKNAIDAPGIFVVNSLTQPGAETMRTFRDLRSIPRSAFNEQYGISDEPVDMESLLWICSNLFQESGVKVGLKRVIVITNNDDPLCGDVSKLKGAETRARDLHDRQAEVNVVSLAPANEFDGSKFYNKITTTSFVNNQSTAGEDEQDALLGHGASENRVLMLRSVKTLKELTAKVNDRTVRKRALTRLPFRMGFGAEFGVALYKLVTEKGTASSKINYIWLTKKDEKPVQARTRWLDKETGMLLKDFDMRYTLKYGGELATFSREEVQRMKRIAPPGLQLMGFKPVDRLALHHNVKSGYFLYPDESVLLGSTTAFLALHASMLKKSVMGVCLFVPRWTGVPRFVALVPQQEVRNENGNQEMPPGFHIIQMPYADDIRDLKLEVVHEDKMPQVQKATSMARDIIKSVQMREWIPTYDPVIRKHFAHVQAQALQLDELEWEDLKDDGTLPNVDCLDARAGEIVQEFMEVCGLDDMSVNGVNKAKTVTPDSARVKRKSNPDAMRSNDGGTELVNLIQSNSLSGLTVPKLKAALDDLHINYDPRAKKATLIATLTRAYEAGEIDPNAKDMKRIKTESQQ
eukprot:Clim_evm34s214 gene=Clim_evmTU34s214